jgi:hypothetical protein
MAHNELIDEAFNDDAELVKRIHDAMRMFTRALTRPDAHARD